MKQIIIPICPWGSHVTTPCLLGGWQNSWLGSEIFPSLSVFFFHFFSVAFVSNSRMCHSNLCHMEAFFTPGLTYQFGTSSLLLHLLKVHLAHLQLYFCCSSLWKFSFWEQSSFFFFFLLLIGKRAASTEAMNHLSRIFTWYLIVFSFHSCSWVWFIKIFVFNFFKVRFMTLPSRSFFHWFTLRKHASEVGYISTCISV